MRFGAATKIIAGGLLVLGSYAYAQDSLPKPDTTKPVNVSSQTLEDTLNTDTLTVQVPLDLQEKITTYNYHISGNEGGSVVKIYEDITGVKKIQWDTDAKVNLHFKTVQSKFSNLTVINNNEFSYQSSQNAKLIKLDKGTSTPTSVIFYEAPRDNFKKESYTITTDTYSDNPNKITVNLEILGDKDGLFWVRFYSPNGPFTNNVKEVSVGFDKNNTPYKIKPTILVHLGKIPMPVPIPFSGYLTTNTSQNVTSTN